MRIFTLLFFCWLFEDVHAQDQEKYDDSVFFDNIRSVKFHHEGLFTSLPIVDLNSGGYLEFSFDDISGDDRNYRYRIVHCDKDWKSSSLDEMEYVDGFNDERLNQYEYSIGTKLNYTHYRIVLPNDGISWRLSGNYALLVIDDDLDEIAVTRRFMVVESKVKIQSDIVRPVYAFEVNSHHEIDFIINHKDYYISNPQREIYVTVMQNGKWDSAMKNLQPRIVTGSNLNFTNNEKVTFEAQKEFRGVDLRSIRSSGFGVLEMDVFSDGYEAILTLDKNRSNQSNFDYDDLNGQFIIETLDDNMDDLKAEYIDVLFSLYSRDEILDKEVCIIGAFCDWRCTGENIMVYDHKNQLYNSFILLKQGYYDYQYALKDGNSIDYTYFEGNDFSTNNEYTILVYQRSFADRYDRLIGVSSVRSNF